MKVIEARNVHFAFARALNLLSEIGVARDSRNGPVLQAPCPVTTVYERPWERVLFWPERDANPFLHLYESLWMLAGRRDIAPLVRYAKNFVNYSDDGETMHGAYGARWRDHFSQYDPIHKEYDTYDQLWQIAMTLKQDPTDRRCVLQMWDVSNDLGRNGKDLPCNLTATFQIGVDDKLHMTVFCRSNDVVWGCYGANAVHFSFLLEYMALWIGVPMGTYTQVSVNWHGYVETLKPFRNGLSNDPYPYEPHLDKYGLRYLPMTEPYTGESSIRVHERVHGYVEELLMHADSDFVHAKESNDDEPWRDMVYGVLKAHMLWRTLPAPERYTRPLELLMTLDQTVDWVVAAQQWIEQRWARHADHV